MNPLSKRLRKPKPKKLLTANLLKPHRLTLALDQLAATEVGDEAGQVLVIRQHIPEQLNGQRRFEFSCQTPRPLRQPLHGLLNRSP